MKTFYKFLCEYDNSTNTAIGLLHSLEMDKQELSQFKSGERIHGDRTAYEILRQGLDTLAYRQNIHGGVAMIARAVRETINDFSIANAIIPPENHWHKIAGDMIRMAGDVYEELDGQLRKNQWSH